MSIMGRGALLALVAAAFAFPFQLAAQTVERVSVLVHLAPGTNRGPVRAFAASQGANVRYEYEILPNVINIRNLPAPAAAALQNVAGVQRVEEDGLVQAYLNDSTPLIRAGRSDISNAGFSATGNGVRVCVIDTGIDSDSVFYSSRIDTLAGFDFVNNDSNPEDDNGHGTHVAAAALGEWSSFQAPAPEATLIGVKVLGSSGSGSFSDVIAGIDHCADDNLTNGRAHVINLSLGGGSFTGACDSDSAATAANNAAANGVVVVAAAGNGNEDNALGTPACGSDVIAVGATFDKDYNQNFTWCARFAGPFCIQVLCTDTSPNQDDVACFSNNSDELDVTAPGCVIDSADVGNSGGGVAGSCGTSQAAPHVGGLAALLLDHDPTLTPAGVRQAIRDGAIDVNGDGFDRAYGWGRIDAINSLQASGPCAATCGNSTIECAEVCDSDSKSCGELGFVDDGSFAACNTDCSGFDTGSACTACSGSEIVCNDGLDNDCDGDTDAADSDCQICTPTQDPETSCNDTLDNDCDELVDCQDSDCFTCGNGLQECGEECDGTDLGGETCESLGLGEGILSCTVTCSLDTSGCVSTCEPDGAACTSDSDCCSNKCRGRPGGKTCK